MTNRSRTRAFQRTIDEVRTLPLSFLKGGSKSLERRINELLHNGTLHDSGEYWGDGNWPKLMMRTWLRYLWNRTYVCMVCMPVSIVLGEWK